MKKTFFSRTKAALAAAVISTAGAGAVTADTVAINFMGDGYGGVGAPVTADAFGVSLADWTDVDAADASGSATVSGIFFGWTINNDWAQGSTFGGSAGDDEVMFGYLDDGGGGTGAFVNITGLSAWLASTGDATYTVQGIQSSDNATTFSDIQLINDFNTVGTLTNSATGPGAVGDATTVSGEFSFDQLSFDVDDRDGTRRGTLSGIIVTSVTVVPEPGSVTVLFGIAGSALAFVRRRKR